MKKWEYKREVFFGGDEIIELLESFGEEGWELCGMIFSNEHSVNNRWYHDMHFKRPIEEPTP